MICYLREFFNSLSLNLQQNKQLEIYLRDICLFYSELDPRCSQDSVFCNNNKQLLHFGYYHKELYLRCHVYFLL